MSVVENLRPVEDYRVIRKRLWNPPNAVHDPENPQSCPPIVPAKEPAVYFSDDEYVAIFFSGTTSFQFGVAASPLGAIRLIQRIVCFHYEVKLAELLSSRRTMHPTWARQVAMYLAKEMTGRSLPEIGRRFGGRDHTTALHAWRKIKRLIENDPAVAYEIEMLTNKVRIELGDCHG